MGPRRDAPRRNARRAGLAHSHSRIARASQRTGAAGGPRARVGPLSRRRPHVGQDLGDAAQAGRSAIGGEELPHRLRRPEHADHEPGGRRDADAAHLASERAFAGCEDRGAGGLHGLGADHSAGPGVDLVDRIARSAAGAGRAGRRPEPRSDQRCAARGAGRRAGGPREPAVARPFQGPPRAGLADRRRVDDLLRSPCRGRRAAASAARRACRHSCSGWAWPWTIPTSFATSRP